MATNLPGKGTLLQKKIASVFTTISNRVEIKGPSFELGIRKTTNLDSIYEEKRPTIADLGTLSLTIWYDPNDTVIAGLRAGLLVSAVVLDEWKLIFNDGKGAPSNDDFTGYLTKFEVNGMKVDETVGADIEIALTNTYTFTAGV